MRHLILAATVLFVMAAPALADDFPGPMVKDKAPFNASNAMMLSGTSCPGTYTEKEFVTDKRKIVTGVKQCVQTYFGISKDIGLDFGEKKYADCVVPDGYETRGGSGNAIWPVCCAMKERDAYRVLCRLYVAPH
ncbi:MAG: hypothetical protein WDO70_08620 [Alphaproteobacteria bacterium]